jgi:hypothetical protein
VWYFGYHGFESGPLNRIAAKANTNPKPDRYNVLFLASAKHKPLAKNIVAIDESSTEALARKFDVQVETSVNDDFESLRTGVVEFAFKTRGWAHPMFLQPPTTKITTSHSVDLRGLQSKNFCLFIVNL